MSTKYPLHQSVLTRAAQHVERVELFDPDINHDGDILLALFAAAMDYELHIAEPAIRLAWSVLQFMQRERGYDPSALAWFDAPERTRAEVLEELRECAKRAAA